MTIPQTQRNERIVSLCKQHPDWSARTVAMVIGVPCTRNTVIGVMARAGVHLTPKSRVGPIFRWPASTRRPIGCRYIHGDPKADDWHYCQARQLKLENSFSAYCLKHHAMCHRPNPWAGQELPGTTAIVTGMLPPRKRGSA